MSPLPDHLLEVRDLKKSFRRRPVLAGVSFGVGPGSVVAVTGANGAGKTTLLRCLAGLARGSGEVRLGGRPVATLAARRQVAYLPQHTDLPEWATVAEVLDFLTRLRGADPAQDTLPAGFLPHPDARVGTLSGGQRRRVALAGVLIGRPSLLLLDEPAANLDDEGIAGLWGMLAGLRQQGAAALLATPSPAEFDGLADRLLVLADGRLVDDRPLSAVRLGLLEETVA
jgi:ABC-type multidrug transport system ATPase subunit